MKLVLALTSNTNIERKDEGQPRHAKHSNIAFSF